ncbi:MAG: LLM class oxidoreductase [Pseudomonadota bacterium]
MLDIPNNGNFASLNRGYNAVFHPGKLSLGLVVPIESYATGPVPSMTNHLERATLAEELGFSAIWLRDVPFNVPSFGDAGQVYDPFVYLGALALQTNKIALGVASIILPVRHPAHVAKAAASVDVLSNGRLLLGIASGDRPEEYPALGISHANRGEMFKESYNYIRQMGKSHSEVDNRFGNVAGDIQMLPKPVSERLPLLITGASRQSPEWIAENGDGWMMFPRPVQLQAEMIKDYRIRLMSFGGNDKPIMEPFYLDLLDAPDAPPRPIHLGLALGINYLREYLNSRRAIGVNHIALNLRFNQADTEATLKRISEEILPEFNN